MDFAQQQRNPGRHLIGFGIVVALHVLLGWALVTGLAQRMIEVIKAPIETKIIEEVKPPPPPPPENLPPPPKFAPPPPSFVPPPEVNVNPPPTPAPTITTTQVAPPPAPVTRGAAGTRGGARRRRRRRACRCAPSRASTSRTSASGRNTTPPRGAPKPRAARRSSSPWTPRARSPRPRWKSRRAPSREHKMLDRLALEAVRACKGTPGTLDGKPEKLTSRITYVWRITD